MTVKDPDDRPTCPRCSGKRVFAYLRAPGFGNRIFLEESVNGQNQGFGELDEGESEALYAWVCKSCGLVELTLCPPDSSNDSFHLSRSYVP